MRRRKPAASTPAAALSLLVAVGAPCGRLCSHAAAAAFHQAASWSRSQAGRPARPGPRQTWRQAQVQEALRRATQRGRRLLIGRWWLHLSLPRRRAGWSILFLFRRWPRSQRYPKLNLRAVSSVSGSREGESCELCITGSLPSSSLARQQVVAQEHPSCPFVEPGKGGSTPVPASSRHTSGCHKPQAGILCFLPHEEESGECYTTHPDPAPAVTGQAVTGPGPGPCVPPRCPTAGTSVARWFRWHGVSEPG